MTDEIEVYEGELSDIGRWARDANEIAQMAAKLVQTSFVPQSYNGKPAEATAAILTGMEVGLKPMASLRSIVVINGTPALTAQALRGLAQAAGHRIWVEESTSQRAVVKGVRRGDDQVQTSIWDVARATAAGLMSKQMYKTQGQSMFVARASSEIVRLVASDVVMGLAYSIEELQDEAPVAPSSEPVKRPSTTARRKPLTDRAPAVEPGLPEQAALEQVADPATGEVAEPTIEESAAEADAREAAEYAAAHPPREMQEPPIDWEPPADDEARS